MPRKDNNLCALRAIIVGKAICDNDPFYESIKDGRNQIQNDRAIQIATELKLSINEEIGLNEIKRIEQHIINYQIIVFNNDQMNELMYVGKPRDKKIFLFYNNNHYDTFKSLPAFFGKKNFCFICMKAYEKLVNHPCNNICKKCKVPTFAFENFKKLDNCLVVSRSNDCYKYHLKNVCNKLKKCEKCGAFQTFKYNCTGSWYNFCKKNTESGHKCYILKSKESSAMDFSGFIFYDYE